MTSHATISAEDERRRAWAGLPAVRQLEWLQQAKEFCAKYLGAAAGREPVPGQVLLTA
jgi:hypothetical protein